MMPDEQVCAAVAVCDEVAALLEANPPGENLEAELRALSMLEALEPFELPPAASEKRASLANYLPRAYRADQGAMPGEWLRDPKDLWRFAYQDAALLKRSIINRR